MKNLDLKKYQVDIEETLRIKIKKAQNLIQEIKILKEKKKNLIQKLKDLPNERK